MSTATYSSWGTLIQRGKFEARVYKESDGRWRTEFDGHSSYWPTEDEAEREANRLLRELAGPNAAREGAPFGDC